MKFLISIILSTLPLISWWSQYLASKRNHVLNSFKKHWTCYYGDWIFVIINILLLYSVNISNKIYVFFIISFLINILSHFIWGNKNKVNGEKSHFYDQITNKLNYSGIFHMVFSIVEMTILFTIFFLEPKLPMIFIELFFVFLFWIFIFYWSKKIHSKIETIDLIVGFIAITSIILKVMFLLN